MIERARKKAETRNSTLNAEFRRWLEQFVETPQTVEDLVGLMDKLSYAQPGRSFSQDEMNER